MLTVVKLIGAPGSWGFLLLSAVIAVALSRTRRRAAIALGCLSALYVGLSLPIVANALAGSLQSGGPHPLPAGTATLVVLGGDNPDARRREAERLARELRPERAVVLGDAWIAQALFDAGFPRDRVTQDYGAARTTREQMAYVARLDRPAARPFVVVASRLQMPRVIRLARASGLEIVPVASGLDGPPATTGTRRWLPSLDGLHVSRDAIYEHAALAYYDWRGWIH